MNSQTKKPGMFRDWKQVTATAFVTLVCGLMIKLVILPGIVLIISNAGMTAGGR